MPPPIPAHMQRFTANPSRPARYRPGKALPEEESSDEEDEEEEAPQQQQKSQRRAPPKPIPSRPPQATADDEDDDDEEGFVTEDEDADEGGAPVVKSQIPINPESASRALQSTRDTVQSQAIRPPQQTQSSDEDEEEEEESDESEDESDEESSSSEEEAPRRKFQRPTFIKKDARAQQPTQSQASPSTITPEISSSSYTDETTARRLAEAEALIKSTIERDTAARLAGRKAWDDDDELPPEALVDDTDNLDPTAEHLAWRLREFHRLKRDRQAMIAREKELEEIERRRNLTKEERDAEDREFIAKQKEEHDQARGQANYMSKYHHKGAFFMDDETSERLAKRDLIGARFQDDVTDKSVLPEYMRVRDMTKLGKKGRTRYTDLKGQDTGRFGDDVKRWKGSGYEQRGGGEGDRADLRGVDERFLPDDERGGGGPRASGANASAVGERRKRERSRSPRRERGGDRYRARSRSGSRDRRQRRRSYSSRRSMSSSRSRSRTRRRSPSPYQERDKRRRVET